METTKNVMRKLSKVLEEEDINHSEPNELFLLLWCLILLFGSIFCLLRIICCWSNDSNSREKLTTTV
ncbi:unnamed protein product [Oikopleura dioica]|uniref:Uncharacterized protein n=1 Tax=Oikopleura dioica TaxID=34765 RepID=E4WXG0_OIKDI|nr:unnamed protein product [Oikopleura dioica]